MTIRYALTRAEVVRAFFVGIGISPRIRTVVLIFALLPALLSLEATFSLSRTVRATDVVFALMWTVIVCCGVFALVYFRAKTAERTLSISEWGISTEIGALKGERPWNKIKQVETTASYILIVGASGNSFFIPSRAFSGSDQRNQFLSEVARWHRPA
jgi:hypothetical protein